MGFMTAMGPCICCGTFFAFNPLRVPSSTAITGQREPICHPCFDKINAKRVEAGMPAFGLLPGAYGAEEVGPG